MVDFNSLDVTATGFVSRAHTYAKSIETAHFGKLYSKAIDGLDYYVIELAAKPALQKAPNWVTSNRAASAIQSHQGLSIVVGAAVTVVSFVLFWIWLHPKGTTPKLDGTGSPAKTPITSDDEADSGAEGLEGDNDELELESDGEVATHSTGTKTPPERLVIPEDAGAAATGDGSAADGAGPGVDDASSEEETEFGSLFDDPTASAAAAATSGAAGAVPPPPVTSTSGAAVADKSAGASSSSVPPTATTSGAVVAEKSAGASSSSVPPTATTSGAVVAEKSAGASSSSVPPTATTSGTVVADKSASASSSSVPPAASTSGAVVDDKSAGGSSSSVPPAATTSGAAKDAGGTGGTVTPPLAEKKSGSPTLRPKTPPLGEQVADAFRSFGSVFGFGNGDEKKK